MTVNADAEEKGYERKRQRIWVDMDCMALRQKSFLQSFLHIGLTDQDDAFALIAVMHCPDLFDIRGFSATFGNGPCDKTFESLKTLVDIYYSQELENKYGKPPVFKGAEKSVSAKLEADIKAQKHKVVGVVNEAAEKIIAELEDLPDGEKLDILATGPLSNIAETVLVINQQKKNHLLDRIGTIFTCGGIRNFDQIFFFGTEQPIPFSDMNFDYDPMAVLILLQHNLDIVFAGFEIATKFWMTEDHIDHLKKNGDEVMKKFASNQALRDEITRWRSWGNIWQQNEPHDTGKPIEGVCPSDLFPAMYMIAPELFVVYEQDAYYGINHVNHPGYSDKPIFKPYLLCPEDIEAKEVENWGIMARGKATYVHDLVNREKFEKVVMALLERPHFGMDCIEKI